jgi:hypothetical protein
MARPLTRDNFDPLQDMLIPKAVAQSVLGRLVMLVQSWKAGEGRGRRGTAWEAMRMRCAGEGYPGDRSERR